LEPHTPVKLRIRDHGFSLFALLLVFFIFLLPIFLENRTLIDSADIFDCRPWNNARPTDVTSKLTLDPSPTFLFHPSDLLAKELFRQGRSFAWNPYVGFGAPWIGQMQASSYFPFKIFEWILPFWEGANLVRIALLLIAGLGSYLLAVSLGLDQAAALISAVSYMFCERLLIFINLPTFQVETLVPLMLFAIHRMVMFKSLRYAIFVGWIGASQFLGGFPESSFIVCLVSLAFFVFLISQSPERTDLKSHIGLGCTAAMIALLLSGFQVAEFVRYLKLANHGHPKTSGWVVHSPADLIHLFAPYYLGFPLQFEKHQWTATSPFDHMRMTLFCGVTTIILAVIGLFGRHSRRGRWFFFACLVFFAGYDFGFPGLKKIGHLPLFDISVNVWNAWVIPFALSILAGYGMHTILNGRRIRRRVLVGVTASIVLPLLCMFHFPAPTPDVYKFVIGPELRRILFAVIGFLVALAWLRHERFKWSTPWLILVVLAVELYSVDAKAGFIRVKANAADPAALEWFLKTPREERIMGLGGIYPADTLLPKRIRDIRHMDAMYPKLYVKFAEAVWPGARSTISIPGNASWEQYDSKLLDLAAVRYVFSLVALPKGTLIDAILDHSKITTFNLQLVGGSATFKINGSLRRVLFQHPPSTIEYRIKIPAGG
jgi:hypothetical protein